jgi:hypothetical protein
MKVIAALMGCALLAGCASDVRRAVLPGMARSEVSTLVGKPVAEGKAYLDYSREPYGYYRVTFGPDDRVRELRDLHTEQNFLNVKSGMTPAEVAALIGVPAAHLREAYGNQTTSWTYRYRDLGIAKLFHVIFDPGQRVLWHYSEWDPAVYSKDGPSKKD